MHSKHVLDNNLSFITPRCLRQGPQCMLLSCFNAIYNFYSFILPSEMIEQIPVIVIAFVYLKYSQRRLSSKSKSAMQHNTLCRIRTDSHEGGVIYPVQDKEVRQKSYIFMNAFLRAKQALKEIKGDVKQALKQCLKIFQIEVFNDVYHIWSSLFLLMSFLYVKEVLKQRRVASIGLL